MKPTLQEGVERRKPPPLHTAGARNSNTQTENRKMEKHFKLTEETIEWQGHTLHRIEATRNSYWANAGDLGGFVESEHNLKGDAWVADNAKVWGSAYLLDESLARDNAQVFDECILMEMSQVAGDSRIHGYGTVVHSVAKIYSGVVESSDDYIVLHAFREIGPLTAYRDTNDMPSVILGFNWYTLPNFIRWAKQRYENNPDRLEEVRLITDLIRLRFDK